MSTTANALTELPAKKSGNSLMNNKDSSSENATTDLSKLGPKATITVNKVDNTKPLDDKEFMEDADSEFGPAANKMPNTATTSPIINIPPSANNTTTITVSTSGEGSDKSRNNKMSPKISDIKESDILDETLSTTKSSNIKNDETGLNNITLDKKNDSKESEELESDEKEESATEESGAKLSAAEELAAKESADEESEAEESAAELVATAAAQIANKTLKKTGLTSSAKFGSKTIKSTGKLLASGKQEQIMKKAMLMMNESGRLNVITDEPTPSIVKLNTPANKAQIKLRAFRQNFERQFAEMRRKTPLQIQTLKAELANIEFAEIGNKNIMTGLLELVDDHELKLLTIEKMLKSGDITLNF